MAPVPPDGGAEFDDTHLLPADDEPGTTEIEPLGQIGPYRLLRVLGEGGMGVVYLAQQDEPVRRRVALKVIKRGMDTKEIVARFEAERQALAWMDHPGIARVYDAGTTEEGRPYFVMELVHGLAIHDYCDRHRLDTRERLRLMIRVCDAVQHAHQKGVIHRDLKPTNVLVTEQTDESQIKIIDFGIAKAIAQPLTDRTLHTEYGVLVGTPEYMSPEQAEPGSLDIDTRTDIYLLGILLYELLVGEHPFDRAELRKHGFSELHRILREVEPPRPSTRIGAVPSEEAARLRKTTPGQLARQLRGDLDWITMKALEKERHRRYATASELAADLQRYLDDEPVLAGPPSASYRLRKFARRYRRTVAAASTVALLVVASLTVITFLFWSTREAQIRSAAEARKFRALSGFMTDVLEAPDPAKTGKGPDTPVGDVLDRAAERIDAAFPDQPEVTAALRNTMGRSFMSLGVFDRANEQLSRGLGESENSSGPRSLATLRLRSSLAELRLLEGRFAPAERIFRRVTEDFEGREAEDRALLVHALSGLQVSLKNQGKLKESADVLRRAIAQQEQLDDENGVDSWDLQVLYQNYARLRQAEGDREEARRYFEKAVEGAKRVRGEGDFYTLLFMRNYAWFLKDLGRHEEAAVLCREALQKSRANLPPDHPQTLITWNHLAGILADGRRFEEAADEYRGLVQVAEKTLQPDDFSHLIFKKDYGACLLELERFEEAEAQLVPASAGLEKLNGVEHAATRGAVGTLVRLYETWEEAEPGGEKRSRAKEWRSRLPEK